MITTSVVFDHHGRAGKGKPGMLEVRVTVDRKPYYVQTGIKVLKSEWQYGSIVNRADGVELTERLALIVKRVEQEINLAIKEGRGISVADIRKRISEHVAESDRRFLDWVDEQMVAIHATKAKGTYDHYRSLQVKLEEWQGIKTWRDVSVENILAFDVWMCGLKNEDGEQLLGEPGRYNNHKCLKALINIAKTVKIIKENPYEDLKGKIKRGEKENVEYLTEDEMLAIRELKLAEGSMLDDVRDLFVFQMFTGLAYGDMCEFDMDDYKKVNGVWIKRKERMKTGVPYVNQLLPPVVEVLEKHDMKLPLICNQDYNRALKIIGEVAGIKTKMHSHLARHTFATYMLSNGVKLQNVSKMLGHTNVVQTQRYAKTLAKDVHDDFSMIADKMKKG